jgi:hypothetical protein
MCFADISALVSSPWAASATPGRIALAARVGFWS